MTRRETTAVAAASAVNAAMASGKHSFTLQELEKMLRAANCPYVIYVRAALTKLGFIVPIPSQRGRSIYYDFTGKKAYYAEFVSVVSNACKSVSTSVKKYKESNTLKEVSTEHLVAEIEKRILELEDALGQDSVKSLLRTICKHTNCEVFQKTPPTYGLLPPSFKQVEL